jgi:hypothetical protein
MMTTHQRKQFLELVQQFRLVTEANREAVASKFAAITQAQASAGEPQQSVLGFCMDEAGNKEQAGAMFNYVLSRCNIVYWPLASVDPSLRNKAEVKQACFKHAMVPIKVTKHMVLLCGTNPHDIDGIRDIFNLVASGEQYPIFVLSEPSRIQEALGQFA